MMEIEREGDAILEGLAELLNEDYEPNVTTEPQAINTVDDPIFEDLSKYEMQLRDSKTFNDKWGDAELRVRDNRASIMEEANLETAAEDTVGFDRLINRGLGQGFDTAPTDLSFKPTFTEPNWFQRNVLRQKPEQIDAPEFDIGEIERPFQDFSDLQLDQLESRINLVEDQLSTNVDSFNTVAQMARDELEVGNMRMNDVADYINQELQAGNERRPLLEEIMEEDITEMDMEAWAEQEFGPSAEPSPFGPRSTLTTTASKTTSWSRPRWSRRLSPLKSIRVWWRMRTVPWRMRDWS